MATFVNDLTVHGRPPAVPDPGIERIGARA